MVEISIDPNLRVENNETVALRSDVLSGSPAEIYAGAGVSVIEPESGLVGWGSITRVETDYLQLYVDWKSLQFKGMPRV